MGRKRDRYGATGSRRQKLDLGSEEPFPTGNRSPSSVLNGVSVGPAVTAAPQPSASDAKPKFAAPSPHPKVDPDLKVNPLQLLGDYSDDEEDGDMTPDVTPHVEENKAEPDANQPLPARQQEIECKVVDFLSAMARKGLLEDVPYPWAAALDTDTGVTYYWNKITQETSWTFPLALDVAVKREEKEAAQVVEAGGDGEGGKKEGEKERERDWGDRVREWKAMVELLKETAGESFCLVTPAVQRAIEAQLRFNDACEAEVAGDVGHPEWWSRRLDAELARLKAFTAEGAVKASSEEHGGSEDRQRVEVRVRNVIKVEDDVSTQTGAVADDSDGGEGAQQREEGDERGSGAMEVGSDVSEREKGEADFSGHATERISDTGASESRKEGECGVDHHGEVAAVVHVADLDPQCEEEDMEVDAEIPLLLAPPVQLSSVHAPPVTASLVPPHISSAPVRRPTLPGQISAPPVPNPPSQKPKPPPSVQTPAPAPVSAEGGGGMGLEGVGVWGVVKQASVAKAVEPTPTVANKRKAVSTSAGLKSNKIFSSLVDKWKAVKEELQEGEKEEEEEEVVPAQAERRRVEEAEAWRREQMATGAAVKANANFQPLVGDWRERVQRAKKASGGEEEGGGRGSATTKKKPRLSTDDEAKLSAATKGLSFGWKAFWDASTSSVYYGNVTTKATSWDRP